MMTIYQDQRHTMEKSSTIHSAPCSEEGPKQQSRNFRKQTIFFFLMISISTIVSFIQLFSMHRPIHFSSSLIADQFSFEPPHFQATERSLLYSDKTTASHTQNNSNTEKQKDEGRKEKKDEGKKEQKDEEENADNSKRRPMNVVIFFPDDMSHKSLQDVSGTDYVVTPFLTALAKDGIRFTRNAVTTSVCWMSRATFFTGQYASAHGSTRLRCPRFTLPEYWKDTWAAVLQRVGGYHVGHVGKWQYNNGDGLGSLFNFSMFFEGRHWYGKWSNCDLALRSTKDFLERRPKDRPFALTVAFYPPKAVGNSYEPGGQWFPKDSTMELYANKTYVPPYNIKKAYKRLPNFLRSGIVSTRYHSRWNSSEKYNVGMRKYHALVTEVDETCQKIVDELKAKGLYENTLIIFTSDNGLLMGSHGLGGKWIAYENSIRVPLIIYDPRMPAEKRGSLDDSMTLNIDLASTILGAANIDPPPAMQGRDLADLYLEQRAKAPVERFPWRTEFVYEYPNSDIHATYALIEERYKYIEWLDRGYQQLFDLKEDPYELNDLLHNRTTMSSVQGVLGDLKKRYDTIRKERVSPYEGGPDWCNVSITYTA